jgi:hypothetical protein
MSDELDQIIAADGPDEEEPGPEWVCCGCGAVNECRTIRYENPTIGVEYDLECNVCGSNEFEEGYHSALHRILDQRDRLQEKLDAMAASPPPQKDEA